MGNAGHGKIALITGANKGIGFEIARQLGEQGLTVLVGVRDADRGREAVAKLQAFGVEAHAIIVDVTDEASVQRAAREVGTTYGRLDVLVNNAGISREGGHRKPSETSLGVVKETYDTNVFGVVAVTNAMLPLLRKAPAARIVNLSSSMGSLAFAADPASQYSKLMLLAYNSSKAALNSVTLEYAKEFRDTPIKINAVDPGYVSTDLNRHQGYLSPEQGAAAPVRLALVGAEGPSGTFQGVNGETPW